MCIRDSFDGVPSFRRAASVVLLYHRVHGQEQTGQAYEAEKQIAQDHTGAPLDEHGFAAVHRGVTIAVTTVAVVIIDLQLVHAARLGGAARHRDVAPGRETALKVLGTRHHHFPGHEHLILQARNIDHIAALEHHGACRVALHKLLEIHLNELHFTVFLAPLDIRVGEIEVVAQADETRPEGCQRFAFLQVDASVATAAALHAHEVDSREAALVGHHDHVVVLNFRRLRARFVHVHDGDVVGSVDALQHDLIGVGVAGEAAGETDHVHHGFAGKNLPCARVPHLTGNFDGRSARWNVDALPFVKHRILGLITESLQAHEIVFLDDAAGVLDLHVAPRAGRTDAARRGDDHIEPEWSRNLHGAGTIHIAEHIDHEGAGQDELAVAIAAP